MRHRNRILGLTLGVALLAGCGGGSSHVDVISQNQTLETSFQSAVCDAGQPSGQGVAGFDGALTSPLYCTMTFQTLNAFLADFVQITVTDVAEVYRQLGTVIPFGGGLVMAELRLMGQYQPPVSGAISFTRISNIAGDSVEADFQIDTGVTQLIGHLSTDVRSGYSL